MGKVNFQFNQERDGVDIRKELHAAFVGKGEKFLSTLVDHVKSLESNAVKKVTSRFLSGYNEDRLNFEISNAIEAFTYPTTRKQSIIENNPVFELHNSDPNYIKDPNVFVQMILTQESLPQMFPEQMKNKHWGTIYQTVGTFILTYIEQSYSGQMQAAKAQIDTARFRTNDPRQTFAVGAPGASAEMAEAPSKQAVSQKSKTSRLLSESKRGKCKLP